MAPFYGQTRRETVKFTPRASMDHDPRHVYVAEAYKDGERIERVLHVHEDDAWEDIEVLTAGDNPDHISVERERVYTGKDAVEAPA